MHFLELVVKQGMQISRDTDEKKQMFCFHILTNVPTILLRNKELESCLLLNEGATMVGEGREFNCCLHTKVY